MESDIQSHGSPRIFDGVYDYDDDRDDGVEDDDVEKRMAKSTYRLRPSTVKAHCCNSS